MKEIEISVANYSRAFHVYDEQTSLEIFERIEQHYSKALATAEQRFTEYVKNAE